MIVVWMLGCGGSAPPPAAEPVTDPGAALSLAVRRAGHSPENACAAVRAALELAPGWGADEPPLGLIRTPAGVTPDWRELALAVGPGALADALITVGGVRDGKPCADAGRLRRWMRRSPTLSEAPTCVRADLIALVDRDVRAVLERPCTCSAPDRADVDGLVAELERLGLTDTVGLARTWADGPAFTPCPTEPPAP